MNEGIKVNQVLISVHNERNIEYLVEKLDFLGIEVISTGKNKRMIENNGNQTKGFSEYTKQKKPDKIKRLQSKLYEGILLHPEKSMHEKYMENNNIEKIEMVVCNTYPIKSKLEKICSVKENTIPKKIKEYLPRQNLDKIEEVKKNDIINRKISNEKLGKIIEIGKVSLIRASAKAALEYMDVAIVTNPNEYKNIIFELEENKNYLSEETITELARNAFEHTLNYEKSIMKILKSKN